MKIIFIIISILISVNCNSIITPEYIIKNHKLITPESPEPDIYAKPKNFASSNNLRHKTGSPFMAKGELLIIEGYLTDLTENPIPDAKINIWQANTFGYYNHLVKDKTDNSKYDEDFESTGTSITDNTGFFSFYTIFPGYFGNRSPHIHFLVMHEDFKTLETEMFFPNHPRNKNDRKYKSMKPAKAKIITCNPTKTSEGIHKCYFNIRLDGVVKNG